MNPTRRELLKLGGAAIACASVSVPAAFSVAAERLPAWVAGTHGEFDWSFIRAELAEEARRLWIGEKTGLFKCQSFDSGAQEAAVECECEFCELDRSTDVDAERVEQLDAIENPTLANSIRIGMGATCSRCGYETSAEEDGHAVGDEAVCFDCMTLADWEKIDPEMARELRAEQQDEAVQ